MIISVDMEKSFYKTQSFLNSMIKKILNKLGTERRYFNTIKATKKKEHN
jgi:hypothetical protein